MLAALAAGADGPNARTRLLLSHALVLGEDLVGRAARAPGGAAGGAGGQRPTLGRHLQGPGHRGRRRPIPRRWWRHSRSCPEWTTRPARATPGRRALTYQGLPSRPADRARGELRQPAPALHRLGAPQRGAAHRGRQARPARERVRDHSTTPTARPARSADEAEVYELLGMAYVAPELRENRGELQAARAGELPELVSAGPTSAATCIRTPSPRTGATRSRRWRAAAQGARLRVHRRDRPLGHARVRQPRDAGRATPPDRARGRGRRADGGLPRAGRERDERDARRLAGLRGRPAGAAGLDRGQRPHLVRHVRARDDRPDGGGDGASAGGRDRPSHRHG